MENTLEPAPSARFLAFFGACRADRKGNAVTTLIYSFAGGTFSVFDLADVQHERIFLLVFRNFRNNFISVLAPLEDTFFVLFHCGVFMFSSSFPLLPFPPSLVLDVR